MEARLESDWQRDAWNIYLTDRGGPRGARRVMKAIDSTDTFREDWIEVSEAATIAPIEATLVLRSDWLEAIVAAGNEAAGLMPPDRAMAVHLVDAIGVRDRLLGLVEGVTVDRMVAGEAAKHVGRKT